MSYNEQKNIKKTKREDGSMRLSITCKVREGRPRAEQSHKGECDIRNIIRRYAKLGEALPAIDPSQYTGEDYAIPPDYTEACRIVAAAQSRFDALPAKIRDRFKNDPQEFAEFINNPKNADEAVKLGMGVKKAPKDAPTPPPNASDTALKAPNKAKASAAPKGADEGQPKGGSDQ